MHWKLPDVHFFHTHPSLVITLRVYFVVTVDAGILCLVLCYANNMHND